MMYPRLFLARQLLRDDGVIFVSIDDHEVASPADADERGVREENFVGCIIRQSGTNRLAKTLAGLAPPLITYSCTVAILGRSRSQGLPLHRKGSRTLRQRGCEGSVLRLAVAKDRELATDGRTEQKLYYPVERPTARKSTRSGRAGTKAGGDSARAVREVDEGGGHRVERKRKRDDGETWWPYVKQYLDGSSKRRSSLWTDIEGSKKALDRPEGPLREKVFDNPKPIELLRRIMQIATSSTTRRLSSTSSPAPAPRPTPFSIKTARTAATAASSWSSSPSRPGTRSSRPSPRSARSASAG